MAGPIDQTRPTDSRAMSHTSFTSSQSSNQGRSSTSKQNGTPDSARAYNASISQPMYSPQFSASTSLIVNRIRNDSRGFNSALTDASAGGLANRDKSAYEDARSKVVKSMNMSTGVIMPPTTSQQFQQFQQSQQSQQSRHSSTASPSASASRSSLEAKKEAAAQTELNPGMKRKRDEDVPDFTQNTMAMPPMKPMPVKKPSPKPGADPYGKRPRDPARRAKIESYREQRLAALPDDAVPHNPQLVGFGSNHASDYARGEYFGNMKKTDVLNVLSFCDQIRPDLLIDLMVSITRRHPDLPIFSQPDWNQYIQEPERPEAQHYKPRPGGPRHGPSLLNSKAKHKIKSRPTRPPTTKKPQKRSRLAQEILAEEEVDEYEGEDNLPSTWPKAGQGMFAKLPPDTEDREFLLDGNDEEAFSHFMVDRIGRQIIDSV